MQLLTAAAACDELPAGAGDGLAELKDEARAIAAGKNMSTSNDGNSSAVSDDGEEKDEGASADATTEPAASKKRPGKYRSPFSFQVCVCTPKFATFSLSISSFVHSF